MPRRFPFQLSRYDIMFREINLPEPPAQGQSFAMYRPGHTLSEAYEVEVGRLHERPRLKTGYFIFSRNRVRHLTQNWGFISRRNLTHAEWVTAGSLLELDVLVANEINELGPAC